MMDDYVSYVVMDINERRLMSNAPHESSTDILAHVRDFIMSIDIEKVKDNRNIEKVKEPILDGSVVCLISHEPIVEGCEYRKCSNVNVSHYYLHEYWQRWENGDVKKCALNDGCEIIDKIFIA